MGPLGDVVLAERHAEGAERVGLDHVGAHLEVGGVQGGDHVGPGDAQDVGAALDGLAAVVVEAEVLGLQPGAGGAVVDDDAFGYEVEEERCSRRSRLPAGPNLPVVGSTVGSA